MNTRKEFTVLGSTHPQGGAPGSHHGEEEFALGGVHLSVTVHEGSSSVPIYGGDHKRRWCRSCSSSSMVSCRRRVEDDQPSGCRATGGDDYQALGRYSTAYDHRVHQVRTHEQSQHLVDAELSAAARRRRSKIGVHLSLKAALYRSMAVTTRDDGVVHAAPRRW